MQETPITTFTANHRNEPAILLGNGPSLELLKPYKDHLIEARIVQIGMNKSWKLWPTQYHCIMFHKEHLQDLVDKKWQTHGVLFAYKDHCESFLNKVPTGNVVYVHDSLFRQDSPNLHDSQMAGLISTYLDEGSSADMTGHFAIEVALWLKCNPIYLIGYDLYGGHFCDENKPEDEWQETQVFLFEETAVQLKLEFPALKVFNLSPKSLIEGFDKLSLEEVFSGSVV
jgi:hypothetical protein